MKQINDKLEIPKYKGEKPKGIYLKYINPNEWNELKHDYVTIDNLIFDSSSMNDLEMELRTRNQEVIYAVTNRPNYKFKLNECIYFEGQQSYPSLPQLIYPDGTFYSEPTKYLYDLRIDVDPTNCIAWCCKGVRIGNRTLITDIPTKVTTQYESRFESEAEWRVYLNTLDKLDYVIMRNVISRLLNGKLDYRIRSGYREYVNAVTKEGIGVHVLTYHKYRKYGFIQDIIILVYDKDEAYYVVTNKDFFTNRDEIIETMTPYVDKLINKLK